MCEIDAEKYNACEFVCGSHPASLKTLNNGADGICVIYIYIYFFKFILYIYISTVYL